MRLFPAILLAVFLSALSGCAVNVIMPSVRFDSPEVPGPPGKGFASLGATGARRLRIVDDTTRTPPVDSRTFEDGAALPITVGMDVLPRLDLELISSNGIDGSTPFFLRAKYQLIGPNRPDAKKGDTSLAVTVGAGYNRDTKEDSGTGILSTAVVNSKVTIETSGFDAALILGHRVGDDYLIYGGVFGTSFHYNARIVQTVSTATTTYDFKDTAGIAGLNLGGQFDTGQFYFRLEGAVTTARSGGSHGDGGSLGIQGGIYF